MQANIAWYSFYSKTTLFVPTLATGRGQMTSLSTMLTKQQPKVLVLPLDVYNPSARSAENEKKS